MATAPPPAPKQDPRTVVRTTQRLWSEEVAIAEAGDALQQDPPQYRFSNGRGLYEPKRRVGES